MKCQAKGCGKDATHRISNVLLCEEHANQQRHCSGGCAKLLQVANVNLAVHNSYKGGEFLLCEACDRLDKKTCTYCRTIVKVGGRTTTTNRPYGDTTQLCENCDQLDKKTCTNCNTIVKVEGRTTTTNRPYGNTTQLCENCDQLDKKTCTNCGSIVEVEGRTTTTNRPYGNTTQLCENCDQLDKKTCTNCGSIVSVEGETRVIYTPYNDGEIPLCGRCDTLVGQRCRACTAPSTVRTPDGRDQQLAGASRIHPVGDEATTVGWRCRVCTKNPLRNTDDVTTRQAYGNAETWMRGWVESCGKVYPGYGDRLTWSMDRDGEFTLDGDGQELGRCTTTTHGDLPKTYRIQVLTFMRPLSFQQTLIHELTHALTHEFGIGDKPMIEGFCNYVAYLYLEHVRTSDFVRAAEAARAIQRMTENPNQAYGVNFRHIRDQLRLDPTQALNWFESNG